jgi:hypothetical protein
MKLFAPKYTFGAKYTFGTKKFQKIQHRKPLKSEIIDSVLCTIHPMKWPPVTDM